MEVKFPKASALCGRVSCVVSMEQGGTNPRIAQTLYVKDLRIPTLIGVNSNEREKKQAVVISVSIDRITDSAMDGYGEVEKHVLEASESATFETLEALAEEVAKNISIFTTKHARNSDITVRIAKPLAVPAADAPYVEITRPTSKYEYLEGTRIE
ncbi:hypothetical protein LTS18_005685 [Coniosporium uncinatum]|uniref:Uncharacterized protein n=1 Tax=Coniosporium uncinatum TaxID=93489 RepID=A0ACC3DR58_9PEZI|nr:hypothetical protein LTS18_005685 [Coniosporium uncinatum]